MKKNLLLFFTLLLFAVSNLKAADYYWVNGGGNWSDLNHWRLGSSTGGIPSIVPSSVDNVFFNQNSGFGTTAATRTVTLDANGFCHSMSWAGVTNNPIVTLSNASFTIEVWGDLALSPDVNYSASLIFKGATVNAIKTNGPIAGYLGIDVDKPGGTLAVTDSLVNIPMSKGNSLALTAGTFDLTGKTVKMAQFNSSNDNTRILKMTGATIILASRWDLRGLNKTLMADASNMSTGGYLLTDGGTYNNVDCDGTGSTIFAVNSTTFSKLTFTNAVVPSYAQVGNSNTVDSLIFMGQGRIYKGNTINYIRFEKLGSILGTDNNVQVIRNLGDFSVEAAPLTVDSLLLAPNKSSSFIGKVTVNKYLEAKGLPCDAFTELTGDTTSFQLLFGAAATAQIDNVYLTGIRATGPIVPLTVTGIDGEGNDGFVINPPASNTPKTYYWVGGAGDWNDNQHWSLSSGGIGGACVPFIYDDVVFDGNSNLTAGSNTVATTGNVYCNNMTWAAGVGTSIFNESTTKRCLIYGSVILAPSVTMNAILEFTGTAASLVTTNASTAGNLELLINKKDNGSLKLMDDWTNPQGIIDLTVGSLDMSDRQVNINNYGATATYNSKHLNITNANIHVSNAWRFTGIYKYMEAAGSVVTSDYIFNVGGLVYPEVYLTYAGTANAFNVLGTTFGSLTFTAPSGTSNASIRESNIIRRLEFKGAGSITAAGNQIDSLILAPSRNYKFTGSTTIKKYMKAVSISCSGLSELRGNTAGTLAFDPAATVDIANVYLMNMTATGLTPAFTGADAGGNTGWVINSAAGSDHYWIGGSGDWNDAAHWSSTSNGAGGACIPTVYDNVIFDVGSGFAAGNNTVTIGTGNAYCHNLDWSGAQNAPIWTKAASWNIEVWGSAIKLNPDATFNVSPLTAKGPEAATLSGNAKGNFDINVDKQDGSLTFMNDYNNNLSDLLLTKGALNITGKKLLVASIDNQTLNNSQALDVSNSSISAVTLWRFDGDSSVHALNTQNSSITTPFFTANGKSYDSVMVSGTVKNSATFSGTNIASLIFTNVNTASKIGINGANNTMGTLNYRGGGAVYGTNNVIDTLIFFPGNTYEFTAGTHTTVNNAWYGSGTPCRLTEIVNNAAPNAVITKTDGTSAFDYIRVKGITGVATMPFTAGVHSTDLGGNIGWDIAPYDGAVPLNGLGDDRAIRKADMPYTIHTDGFFGTPLAEYTWGDGSKLDSLVITDTGTYKVNVRFEDGCTVSDSVHITYDAALPVNLTNFDIEVQNCLPALHWSVGEAVNLKDFVVERSTDGKSFDQLGTIGASFSSPAYTYTDNQASANILYYYRLKLMDANNQLMGYSKVKTAKSACGVANVKLYPNPTSGIVNIDIPVHQGQVQVMVYNTAGQNVAVKLNSNGSKNWIDLSHAAAGVYIIEVLHDHQIDKFKVLKK